jgi:hypothetical protein
MGYARKAGEHERSPRAVWRHGPAARALACSLRGHRPTLAPRIGRPGISKSIYKNHPMYITAA